MHEQPHLINGFNILSHKSQVFFLLLYCLASEFYTMICYCPLIYIYI